MAINNDGLSANELIEAMRYCAQEDESAVGWYQTNLLDADITKISDIFFIAIQHANLPLVEHILEHKKQEVINRCHADGRTALFFLLHSNAPIQKILSCARLLINSGADINARHKTYNSEDYNVLGVCITALHWRGSRENNFKYNQEALSKFDQLAQLLISHQAKCYIRGDADYLHFVDDDTTKNPLREYADWSKIRQIFLAHRSKETLMASLPTDLINLMVQFFILDKYAIQ